MFFKFFNIIECFKVANVHLAGIRDRVFVCIKFKASNTYGVAWKNFDARAWQLLEFAVQLPIQQLIRFESNLVIRVDKPVTSEDKIALKFYKIPMR
jgi:hypothetical protein